MGDTLVEVTFTFGIGKLLGGGVATGRAATGVLNGGGGGAVIGGGGDDGRQLGTACSTRSAPAASGWSPAGTAIPREAGGGERPCPLRCC